MIITKKLNNLDNKTRKAVQTLLDEVDQAFFSEYKIEVLFSEAKTNWLGETIYRKYERPRAIVYMRTVRCYYAKKDQQDRILKTLAHELGHLYHYINDPLDHVQRTDYGKEVYAEEFVAMVFDTDLDLSEILEEDYHGTNAKQIYKG